MKKNIGNRGFSLVELLSVVAIIGILAVIGIPQYQKFRIKAFQAEAKTQLASIHGAERVFQLEHGTFHASLQAIGFSPMGRARYNIGFGFHDAAATTSNTYLPPVDLNTLNTKSMCSGPFGLGTDSKCQMVNDTPTISNSATAAKTTYIATAVAYEEQLVASNPNPTLFSVAVDYALGTAAFAGTLTSQDSPVTPAFVYDSWVIDQDNVIRKALLTDSTLDCEKLRTCGHSFDASK